MLNILKQIFLWLYFVFVRSSKRKRFLDKIGSKCKRRNYIDDIPDIPSVLDEINVLPEEIQDTISFVGFSKEGHTLGLQVHYNRHGQETVFLDLDIAGYGHFSYNEFLQNKRAVIHAENLIGSKRIKVYCLKPMKRWKLSFRGQMKHKTDNANIKLISVYWHCLSDPYDHFVSTSCWTLARNLSAISWKALFTSSLNIDKICYEQLGEMRARVEFLDNTQLILRLKSVKERVFKEENSHGFDISKSKYLILEQTGLFLSTQMVTLGNGCVSYFGNVIFPFGDFSPTETVGENSAPHIYPDTCKACGNIYRASENVKRSCFKNGVWQYEFIKSTVNGKPAFGIQRAFDNDLNNKKYEIQHQHDDFIQGNADAKLNENIMVVAFDELVCRKRLLVGGKGSQLAIVKSLGVCNVPNGICLTANAYMKQIQEHPTLKTAYDAISKCLQDSEIEKLKTSCETAVCMIQELALTRDLKTAIKDCLYGTFGNEQLEKKKFAVRSSSVSEDGTEASYAGQLDTVLCVQGFDNIIDAVKKCWASSVAYQIVEYRRQNGQNLTESMGVVIQEMVNSDTAGVIFTNDPVTGDESKMIINASLGLGEAVVSGKITPDTIFISRKNEEILCIENIMIGQKTKSLVDDNKGHVVEVLNSDSDTEKVCLGEEDIKRLCIVAIEIEKNLNGAQDIEWAISKGIIYILQTRPITALDTETDEEIIHEFDSPIMGDSELITPCNIQESIPGAITPLSTDILIPATDRSVKYSLFSRLGLTMPIHILKTEPIIGGIALLNLSPIEAAVINGIGGEMAKRNVEVNVLGMTVEEHTVESLKGFYGRTTSWFRKLKNELMNYFILNKHDFKLYQKLKEQVETFKVGEEASSARALYKAIDDNLWFYFEMWRASLYITTASSMRIGLVMSILKGSSKEITVENNADMALILSECKNVQSADVPAAINNLGKLISTSADKDTFLGLSLDECDAFIRNSTENEIQSEYARFMKMHGHRGIREPDFIEKSWKQEPSRLMKMLKMVVQKSNFEDRDKDKLTIDELVDKLQTPLSSFKKRLLKRSFVKKAMDGVADRELAKSNAIKASSIFKEAYWRLANMMVREGRLPDDRLLFFLTHREIDSLIDQRSVRLIKLAKRRMKLLPVMDRVKYSKVNFGIPKPIQIKTDQFTNTDFTLSGMAVCRGKAIGRACSIQTVDDADQIREGDILVCRYTDVGWSPYFPLINGLVTEMGGLISHGAVVAREYGIPCIVNVTNATELITTGDRIAIDGTAGKISKVDDE